MTPKYGGNPLAPAPDCLQGEHLKAVEYVRVLEAALEQPGWSQTQRQRIRTKYRKWLLCAEGRDPYFEQFGTFARFEGSPPPTSVDLVVARWRKRFPRTKEERRRRQMPKRFTKPKGDGL